MYGYFDPDGAFLKNNERSVFHAYYCRLCYCLWNKGGQVARYLTTYDATVYNLILAVAGEDDRPPVFACQRIKTQHKKYFKDDPIGNLVADLSVIGFAIKVKDNEADGDKFKAFCANLAFGKMMKKTCSEKQDVFDVSYKMICDMDRLQQSGAPIEEVLAAYGAAMESGFRYYFKVDEKYYRCINRVARWILLVDMIDDYDSDYKRKLPNSLRREDSATIAELFEKYYWELIPLIQDEIEGLKNALFDIENESTEWIVLNKLLRHSMATLIPKVLNGEDIGFHYFKDTCHKNFKIVEEKRIKRKHEKNSVNN